MGRQLRETQVMHEARSSIVPLPVGIQRGLIRIFFPNLHGTATSQHVRMPASQGSVSSMDNVLSMQIEKREPQRPSFIRLVELQ